MYTTCIFRIGVTTKVPNITAMSIPWRKCPYRGRPTQMSTTVCTKISLLQRTCLWIGNDGKFSNIFHIGKGLNLKNKYNPIKSCWLKQSTRIWVFFYTINHLIIYDFMVFTAGLGSSKVLVLGTWYLMQYIEYLVVTGTWPFEIQKYLALTCTIWNGPLLLTCIRFDLSMDN